MVDHHHQQQQQQHHYYHNITYHRCYRVGLYLRQANKQES